MVLVISIGRDGAFDLLKTWAERRTLIRLDFAFVRFALCVRVRIRELRPDRVDFLSDDTLAEAAIALRDDAEFAAGHFATEAPDDAATYGKCLAIYFPVPNSQPETLNLIEVKEDE